MIDNLLQRGLWRFLDTRTGSRRTDEGAESSHARRLWTLTLASATIAVVAVVFAVAGYVRQNSRALDAQIAASRVETANIDLQDELSRLRDKIAVNNRDLTAAQTRVAALVEEARVHPPQPAVAATSEPAAPAKPEAKSDTKGSQLSSALHVAEAQRATLAARLSKAEADLVQQQQRQVDLQAELEQWQKKLQQITADRDKTLSERDRLRARVGELEKQSALRHQQQQQTAQAAPAVAPPAAAVAAPSAFSAAVAIPRPAGVLGAPAPVAAQVSAAPAPAPAPVVAQAAPAPSVASPAVGNSSVDHFARVLASAGVDVRHLFAQYGVNRGEGGPFIPLAHGQVPDRTLSPEKLAALQAMVKVLPVAAPLASFDVSSPFGARGDPENGHAGFHTGIDLTAPYQSPVYATAPGVVTFAGYRSDYGKIVEIDHGNGIATRYAHLARFTVSVGQRVAARTQVGELGSTGRATGPHVHYEVVVNGEPQDPEKFFGLARYVAPLTVPVAARN